MVEDTRIGWDFHDRGPLKTFDLQYLQHAGTIQVTGIHARVGPAVPRLLEVDNLDHIHRQGLKFRQRVALRITSELVSGVRTQPQIPAFVWRQMGPRLPYYQGHTANGLSGVLHRQDHPLPGGLPGQVSHAQSYGRYVCRLFPGMLEGGGVNEAEMRC